MLTGFNNSANALFSSMHTEHFGLITGRMQSGFTVTFGDVTGKICSHFRGDLCNHWHINLYI